MDLARMIVVNSRQIDKEEKNKNKIRFNITFGSAEAAKSYDIYIKPHKVKNTVLIEYMGANFRQKKNTCPCDVVGVIFRQVCRKYLADAQNSYFDEDDEVKISITYKDQELVNDTHSITAPIHKDELSSSPNSPDEDYEVDMLMEFFMDYYKFVDKIEF